MAMKSSRLGWAGGSPIRQVAVRTLSTLLRCDAQTTQQREAASTVGDTPKEMMSAANERGRKARGSIRCSTNN